MYMAFLLVTVIVRAANPLQCVLVGLFVDVLYAKLMIL